MMRTLYLLLTLLLVLPATVWAQIGISGPPNASAVLDLQSPNHDKAFYPPRLSTAQRLAIVNPQVGALVYDLDKNTLYLYDGQNWLPLLTTSPNLLPPTSRTASDGVANDYFGYSVAISGDYAIVGAYQKTIGNNSNQGAAYVFVRSGSSWTQQQRLVANDGAANNNFGNSVAISGAYAIVGAYAKTIGSIFYQGAAYVFVQGGGTWTQQQRLVASDGAAADQFGISVAVSGDYALVGANNKTIGSNSNQGAAYVFARSGSSWPQQQRLVASDGAAYDNFGYSVAISGDYAIAGAYAKAIGGAAYVYMRSGGSWPQQQRVNDNSPASTGNGVSVGLSNGTYIIGGYGYQTNQGKISFGTVN